MNNFKTVAILKIEDKGDGVHFLWYTENDKILNLEKQADHWYIVKYHWKDRELLPLSLSRYVLYE